MDICHLKNAELEAKHQKYKGRVVLRGDIVRDNSGSYAVFTEQGSSASQMTAAKISWISSPDCLVAMDKQQTQYQCIPKWKWKMLTNIENSKIGVSRHLDSSTTTLMAKIMVQYGRPSRSSWKEFVRSSFGRTIVGKAIWENSIETWLGENSKLGECLFVHREKGLFICGWLKIGWKETKSWSDVESTWQRSRFGRNNIFLGSRLLGLHSKTMPNKQRYCGQLQNHVRIENFRGGSREITIPSKSSYFIMVLWHGWSCKEVCGCIDDYHFKEETKSVGELSNTCSQTVLKCLYLARIGRPDILWSVNKLARSITKWTKACDKRLNRLISFNHHTCEYKKYCHVGKTDCFRTLTSREILKIQNPLQAEHYAFLEVVHLFQ